MRIKHEHLLIAIIVLIGLHLLMNRCRCNRFSVGAGGEDHRTHQMEESEEVILSMIDTAIEKNQYYLSDPQTEVGSLATNLGYSGRDKDDASNLYRAARSASNSGEINDYIVNAVRLINLITTDDSNASGGLGSRIFKESLEDYGYLDDEDIDRELEKLLFWNQGFSVKARWTLWPSWETREIEIHEDSLLIRVLSAGVSIIESEIPFDTADLSITGDTIDQYMEPSSDLPVKIEESLVNQITITSNIIGSGKKLTIKCRSNKPPENLPDLRCTNSIFNILIRNQNRITGGAAGGASGGAAGGAA